MIKHKYLYLYGLILTILCNIVIQPLTVRAETYTVSNTTVYLTDLTGVQFPTTHLHTAPDGTNSAADKKYSSSGGCFTSYYYHSHSDSCYDNIATVTGPSGWQGDVSSRTQDYYCSRCGETSYHTKQFALLWHADSYEEGTTNPNAPTGHYEYYSNGNYGTHRCGLNCGMLEGSNYSCNCGKSTSTVIANLSVSLVNGKIHCTLSDVYGQISNITWTATAYNMDGTGAAASSLSGNPADFSIQKPKYKITATFKDSYGATYTANNITPFIAAITVDYNGTDNTGGATASHLIYYTDYTANTARLSANGFTRDGYDFVTWNSKYSSNLTQIGTSINPGIITKAQIDSIAGGYNSFTMYAVWKAHPYSIEFYPNNPNFITDDLTCDGTVIDTASYKYTDTGYKYHDSKDTSAKRTFPACKYRKVGYRFLGWGFTPQTHTWNATTGVVLSTANVAYANNYAGDNIRIPNGASTRSPNNNEVIKLYAQWEPIEFTLTMHSNDQYNSVDEPVGDVSGHNINIHCTYDRYVTISSALAQFNTWYNDPIVTGLCSKEDYLLVNSVYPSTEQDLRFGDGAFVELTLNTAETGYTSSQKTVTAESKTPNETVGDMMDLDHIFYADTRMTDVDGATLDIYCIRDIYHIFYNVDTNKPTKVIFVSPDGTQTKVKGIFMNDMNRSRSREYLIFGH